MDPDPWEPPDTVAVGASYVCFVRGAVSPGGEKEPGWAAASRKEPGRRSIVVVSAGVASGPYVPGSLALREGPLRSQALESLSALPDVVLVDATGRDHPRRAGLALHLGALFDLPSVGVTNRALTASGHEPADARGAVAPLRAGGDLVGYLVRCRAGARPVCVSPGWRMSADVAVQVVLDTARKARTPQPLREARRAARAARDREGG